MYQLDQAVIVANQHSAQYRDGFYTILQALYQDCTRGRRKAVAVNKAMFGWAVNNPETHDGAHAALVAAHKDMNKAEHDLNSAQAFVKHIHDVLQDA